MPSAEKLAEERAREEQCERELRLLHEQHEMEAAAILPRCESSGSEGEAGLAAAVRALVVQPIPTATQAMPEAIKPNAMLLVTALAARIPLPDAQFLHDYLDALLGAVCEMNREHITDQVVSALCSVRWDATEGGAAVTCGAWLCAASVWSAPRVRRTAVRAALRRLGPHLTVASQIRRIAEVVRGAIAEGLLLLEVCDALRGTSGGGAHLTTLLLHAALVDLLHSEGFPQLVDYESEISPEKLYMLISNGWRGLDVKSQYAVVQLTGRAIAMAKNAECWAEIPALLAQQLNPLDRHQPEHLKVLVAVSKLQLLFVAKK